jgi:hypothetical protein
MGLLNLFKLEKLKIHVYGNRKRMGVPQSTFEVMFNPESYSLSYENQFNAKQGINTSGRSAKYTMSKPSDLSLKIILDGTGVSNYGLTNLAGKKKDVYKEVQKFLKLTSYMDGKIHEPKFLKIEWGDLIFKCRLKKADVSYTLFEKSGVPLRAEIDATFIGDLEDSERLKNENKSSPDLTHVRLVKAHDTLPLLCEEIYGAPHYYLTVAAANKLDDFRNLIPGTELFFPPLEK